MTPQRRCRSSCSSGTTATIELWIRPAHPQLASPFLWLFPADGVTYSGGRPAVGVTFCEGLHSCDWRFDAVFLVETAISVLARGYAKDIESKLLITKGGGPRPLLVRNVLHDERRGGVRGANTRHLKQKKRLLTRPERKVIPARIGFRITPRIVGDDTDCASRSEEAPLEEGTPSRGYRPRPPSFRQRRLSGCVTSGVAASEAEPRRCAARRSPCRRHRRSVTTPRHHPSP